MEHAKIPDGFFDFGKTGIDGDACELILSKLDDDICGRFLGAPEVGLEFSETTAAHEVRTYKHIDPFLRTVIRDREKQYDARCHYKAMIVLHDVSDILKEVIIATTETDPKLRDICNAHVKNYDMTVTPFVYRLALLSNTMKSPTLFEDMIDRLRETLLVPEQHGRGLTIHEAMEFCNKTVNLVQEENRLLNRFTYWKSGTADEKVATMLGYYNEIEQTASFAGMQSQIHEKCDGTDYACTVSSLKLLQSLRPTHYHMRGVTMNRLNSRYEKNLNGLFNNAATDEEMALAALTTQYCYRISQLVYTLGKPFVCFKEIENEPGFEDDDECHRQFALQQETLFRTQKSSGIHEQRALVNLYGSALMELGSKGICFLPEENKTLATSVTPQCIQLNDNSFALARDMLQAFTP